jgi:hypothetical protein
LRDTLWYFDVDALQYIKVRVLPVDRQPPDAATRARIIRIHDVNYDMNRWFGVPHNRIASSKKAALSAARSALLDMYKEASQSYKELEKRMNKIESLLLKVDA